MGHFANDIKTEDRENFFTWLESNNVERGSRDQFFVVWSREQWKQSDFMQHLSSDIVTMLIKEYLWM